MNIEHEICKKLVTKFIEQPNFPREIKIAKKLLFLSPDVDSWMELNLPYKIPSLAFFLTETGSVFVPSSQKNPYLLDLDKFAPKSKKIIENTLN